MTPSEVVPRRVRMQQQGQLRGKEDALDDAGLSPEAERNLLPNMLTDNLEVSWAALNETVSRVSAFGVPVEKFAKMLFDARWISRDSMPTLMRTYACDAGIDAALVVTDLWQCIKQPGFSAARYPAAMQLLIHSVLHVLSNLESRFRRSDDQAVESVKGTGARPQSEEPARHVDVEILSEHLRCSGFELKQASLVLLQRIYCCGEGQWKGYINYERLLADLRKAAEPYLQATSKSWNWNFTETSTTKGAQAFGAERRGAIKRAGRIGTGGEQAGVRWEGDSEWDRRDREGLGHGHRQHGAIDVWERPNTPSDILRPDSAHSSRLSEFSRPGTATDWQQDDGTTASRPSSVNVFGDPKAILRQSATFEHKLRDRMVPVVHNIENILRCFQDVDMKKAKTVSERAVEDVLRPYTRHLILKDVSWIIARFSSDGMFRYEEFLSWCLPPQQNNDETPKLLGRVPTPKSFTVSMRGPIVQAGPDVGLNAFQPTAAKNQLRMPPPPRRIPTPSEWAMLPSHPPHVAIPK